MDHNGEIKPSEERGLQTKREKTWDERNDA